MSDALLEARQERSDRNAKSAVDTADKLRNDVLPRLLQLEQTVAYQNAQLADLQRKYNLLLTSRFDGKATS